MDAPDRFAGALLDPLAREAVAIGEIGKCCARACDPEAYPLGIAGRRDRRRRLGRDEGIRLLEVVALDLGRDVALHGAVEVEPAAHRRAAKRQALAVVRETVLDLADPLVERGQRLLGR